MYQKLAKLASLFTVVLAISHSACGHARIEHDLEGPEVRSIHDYKTVLPTIILQSEETTHGNPHELWIRINTLRQTFELHLLMNRDLLSPDYTDTYIVNDKIVSSKELENCYYHGSVVGFPHWSAALSTCDGLRGAFGDFTDMKCLHHIDPVKNYYDEIQQPHTVYRNGSCGDKNKYTLEPTQNFITKLGAPDTRVRVMEWVIVNDHAQYVASGSSVSQAASFARLAANFVDMIFAKLNISIRLIGSQTWSSEDLIPSTSDSSKYLHLFKNYRPSLIHIYPSHDSAMLLSGIDFDGTTVGLAYDASMCNQNPVGLAQAVHLTAASVGSVASHELGHIFGMEHDDERNCTCTGTNGHCIMNSYFSTPPSTTWSSCSFSDIQKGYDNNLDQCLFNEPAAIETTHLMNNEVVKAIFN